MNKDMERWELVSTQMEIFMLGHGSKMCLTHTIFNRKADNNSECCIQS